MISSVFVVTIHDSNVFDQAMNTDMCRFNVILQTIALHCTALHCTSIITAIEKYSKDFEKCSGNIKEDMDRKFGAPWNCVVGEFFGFEITHEVALLSSYTYTLSHLFIRIRLPSIILCMCFLVVLFAMMLI